MELGGGLRWWGRGGGGLRVEREEREKAQKRRITATVNLGLLETINQGSLQNLLKKTPVSCAPTTPLYQTLVHHLGHLSWHLQRTVDFQVNLPE